MRQYWHGKTTLLLLCCWLSGAVTAQQQDSLWKALQSSQDDSERFGLFTKLSSYYVYNRPDSALSLLERAQALRSSDITQRQAALFHRQKSLALKQQSHFEDALICLDSSLLLFRAVGDSLQVAKALINKGSYFQQLDRLQEAFECFSASRRLLENYGGEDLTRAKALNNLSVIYTSWGMHAKAIALLFEAIEIKERLKDYGSLANSYGTLASIYIAREERELGLKYYQKAVEAARQSKNRYLLAAFMFNLGEVNKELEQYEKAETLIREAQAIAYRIENDFLLGHCSVGLAEVAFERGNSRAAGQQLERSLKLKALQNSPYLRASAYLLLSEIAMEKGLLPKAVQMGERGLEESNSAGAIALASHSHKLLAQIYERKGQADDALFHFKKYKKTQDSILSEENSNKVSQLQAQYDYQLKQKDYELQLANTEQKLDRAANQAQRWYMLFISLGLLLLGGLAAFLLYANRQHRRSQEELNSMNEELYNSNENLEIAYLESISIKQQLEIANHKLQQFVFAASHDLKESIRNINSFTQLLRRELQEQTPPQQLEAQLHFITDNSQRMDKLLNDLLQYYEIPDDRHQRESVDLNGIVELVLELCADAIQSSKAEIECTTPLPHLQAAPLMMEQLFLNLLSNALQYRSVKQPPQIEIGCRQESGATTFFVLDNGVGIAPEHREDIFRPFFRLHSRGHSGSGMGLAISQRIVESYGGKIWVDGQSNGSGTKICFTLPGALPEEETAQNPKGHKERGYS